MKVIKRQERLSWFSPYFWDNFNYKCSTIQEVRDWARCILERRHIKYARIPNALIVTSEPLSRSSGLELTCTWHRLKCFEVYSPNSLVFITESFYSSRLPFLTYESAFSVTKCHSQSDAWKTLAQSTPKVTACYLSSVQEIRNETVSFTRESKMSYTRGWDYYWMTCGLEYDAPG